MKKPGEKIVSGKNLEAVPEDGSVGTSWSDLEEFGKEVDKAKAQPGGIGQKIQSVFGKFFAKKEKIDDSGVTIEQKAKKKGYFKNEDGVWVTKVESYGETKIEEMPGFELDEKYPEVAEKLEESFLRYREDFPSGDRAQNVWDYFHTNDKFGMKHRMCKNIENFKRMSDENWDDVMRISSRMGSFYHDKIYDLMTDAQAGVEQFDTELQKNVEIRKTLDDLYEGMDSGREKYVLDFYLTPNIVRSFSDEAKRPEFTEAVRKYVGKCAEEYREGVDKNDELRHRKTLGVASGLSGILEHGGGEFTGDFVDFFEEVAGNLEPIGKKWKTRGGLFANDVARNGMSAETVPAFRKIFELIEANDPELRGFGEDYANSKEGYYGAEDYVAECFKTYPRPRDIDRLVRIHNEIPTANFANREQNRRDAYEIERAVINDRSFIHNERPGVHEMISAIVDYYDAPADEKEEKREIVEKMKEKYGLVNAVGDIPKNIDEWETSDKKEKMIDVLRRLKKNTEPVPIEAPKTKYPELDEMMDKIDPIVDEKTGEIKVSIDEVGDAVAKMNQILQENGGELGIFPSTISAVVFLDKMAACALRRVDKKDWQELAFDPKFKEIVRFSQMTSSMGYDEREFEGFYDRFRTKCGEAFTGDGVDDEKVVDGYKVLSERITKNARDLGSAYAADEETKRFAGAVWSGNLTHELIGMFDKN